MHMNFGTLLFCVAVYVSVPEVHSAGSTTTCFTLTNTTTSHYFHAFEALERSNKHEYGCASNGNVEASATTKIYQENHIIDVENDRAADIYLNINGIRQRTTNSLPQYEKYRYEFALLSEKDVIWLVSLRNMPNPNSSVSFKFYFSPGSHVISRDGREFPLVMAGVERKYMSAQAFLNMYKKDIFQGKELTSFSQISSPQIAAVNISVGPKQDSIAPSSGNFTTSCNKAEKNYLSPIVSVAKYRPSLPSLNCESLKAPQKEPNLGRAYIVDVKVPNLQDETERLPQIVNLEAVGKESSRSNNDAILNMILVLRSNTFTVWRVNIARELRPTTVKFVIGHGDEIKGVPGTEVTRENLDYDENDYTTLTRSIETRYRCSLASYVQYDSPTDLIFLSLSESEDQLGPAKFDRDSLTDKANDIVRQSERSCGDDDWSLNVPMSVLNQYDLSSNNLEVGDDCLLMEFGGSVMFMLMDCNSMDDEGIFKTELKVTFRTQGKHLFPSPVKETETISIPLQCNPHQVNPPLTPDVRISGNDDVEHVFNFSATCDMDVFFVEITDNDAELLNVTAIAECESARINGYTEYTFRRDFERSCGATFEDGIFRIKIPMNISDGGVPQEPKELPCKPQIVEVTTNYDLQVFKDFNLRNLLSYGPILVQPDQQNTDETTYHIKVFLITNDPLLTVYLSRCSLKQDSKVVQRLIRNNCPASNIVSFVRPLSASRNHAQHFVVKIGKFFPQYERLRIECAVTACCTTDSCGDHVIRAPKCFHPHGDGCSQGDIEIPYELASYHPDIVMSHIFQTAANSTTYGTGDESGEKNTASIGTSLLVILAFGAFFLGCIFVAFIWLIDARYKHRNSLNKRKSAKSESGGGGENGSSASTGSTKTTGSSFSSLFCLKIGKSSSPSSSPTASKDNLELKPFIPSSTSTNQPQNTQIRSKIIMGSESRTNPTSRRANGDSVLLSLNCSLTVGPVRDRSSLEHGMTACSKSQDTELSSQPSVLVVDDALRFVDAAVSIPHSESPSGQTSSERTHLQFANNASAAQTKTPQDTSPQPRHQWYDNGHRSTSTGLKDDCRLNSGPVQVSQDEFARLKEEAV